MKPRIHTDTSVLGGCEDEEFREPSRRLLAAFQRGELTLVLSELTRRELDSAPPRVRLVVRQVPVEHVEVLSLSPGRTNWQPPAWRRPLWKYACVGMLFT